MNINSISKKHAISLAGILLYFILCFYHFGVTMMIYFFDYAAFGKIKENIPVFFKVFNDKMWMTSYIPSVIMLIAAAFLLFNQSAKMFPRKVLWASLLLAAVSVTCSIFIIYPIHASLVTTGFTTAIENKLLPLAFNFLVIPAAIQVLLALFLLNIYVKDTKITGRFLFIIVFALTFYTMGTGRVEGSVNYPLWHKIAETDWLPFRFSGTAARFFGTFIIPAFLPSLLIIPLCWLHPKGIPKSFNIIFLAGQVWIFIITALYFIPRIQLPLNNGYSLKLIEELGRYEFPLRGIAACVIYFITGWMFIKIGKLNMINKDAHSPG